jgi:single-strand DNA-binding protein
MNTGNLIGRVGGDPDVKYFESGSVKATFTLAVNRRSKNTDQPDWFNIECWGKTAEVVAKYVKKGKQVGVTGSLIIESWKDKQTGTLRSKPVIKTDKIELLGTKEESDSVSESDEDE